MADYRQQIPDEVIKAASVAAVATDMALVVSLSPNSPVPLPVLTKGTQGNNGVTTQDLKDAGRSLRTITMDTFAIASTLETLNSLSISADSATPTTGTQYTVTAGKRFRVQQITSSLDTTTGNTVAASVIVRLRSIVSGTLLVTSPLQMIYVLPGIASVNGATQPVTLPIPDGMEFVALNGIGVTTACAGFVLTTAAPKVNLTITGYEY